MLHVVAPCYTVPISTCGTKPALFLGHTQATLPGALSVSGQIYFSISPILNSKNDLEGVFNPF